MVKFKSYSSSQGSFSVGWFSSATSLAKGKKEYNRNTGSFSFPGFSAVRGKPRGQKGAQHVSTETGFNRELNFILIF